MMSPAAAAACNLLLLLLLLLLRVLRRYRPRERARVRKLVIPAYSRVCATVSAQATGVIQERCRRHRHYGSSFVFIDFLNPEPMPPESAAGDQKCVARTQPLAHFDRKLVFVRSLLLLLLP